MRAISPNTGAPETRVAEDQHDYIPLDVAFFDHGDGCRSLVTAWVPDRDDLDAMARTLCDRLPALEHGAARAMLQLVFRSHPVFVRQVNWGGGMTPMMVSSGPEAWMLAPGAEWAPGGATAPDIPEHSGQVPNPTPPVLPDLLVADRGEANGPGWHALVGRDGDLWLSVEGRALKEWGAGGEHPGAVPYFTAHLPAADAAQLRATMDRVAILRGEAATAPVHVDGARFGARVKQDGSLLLLLKGTGDQDGLANLLDPADVDALRAFLNAHPVSGRGSSSEAASDAGA
jgi:hypothetical protein